MTRDAFLKSLRHGLRGLRPETAAEITADYEAYFTEGLTAGRSEADIAQALGDPSRLARELRAEAGLKRWEAERDPAAAVGAIIALVGLGAVDLVLLLPVATGVAGLIFGLFSASAVCLAIGAVIAVIGPFTVHGEPPLALLLMGLGLVFGASSAAAIAGLISIGLFNGALWYGRLHLRLLRPALQTQEMAS